MASAPPNDYQEWPGASSQMAHGRTVDLHPDSDMMSRIVNSMFVWRLIRGDERIKIFKCLTALTPPLCQIALPLPDPQRALFCEIFLFLTRPKALQLPPNTFFAIFIFNRERRYCATTTIRSVSHPSAEALCALTFHRLRAAEPPEENPDPSAEQVPTNLLAVELEGEYAIPSDPPGDPRNCCLLSPGAWWHYPSGQIYCWMMDEDLLPLCPPGSRARTLGWFLAKLTGHGASCADCAPRMHIDATNALWHAQHVAEVCPCCAPCMWTKMAQRVLAVRGDASLCQLLFDEPVEAVALLESVRAPRITAPLDDVLQGRYRGESIPPVDRGWELCVFSSYVSRLFATSCPTIARRVSRHPPTPPDF
ncbi:tegument protein [pteropodid alphaherpesvirus 2]|uniref:Tegument protein n=1 Tax=pteropodid alphaherpesvirus 2 TaxID=3118716 RepID=A0A510J6N5_9ALPH|nr:tegument protein [pteropodid alphaherpesvirus 2]BBM13188.1 tegument protein [pteropodid alphaherpesvirus 2]